MAKHIALTHKCQHCNVGYVIIFHDEDYFQEHHCPSCTELTKIDDPGVKSREFDAAKDEWYITVKK